MVPGVLLVLLAAPAIALRPSAAPTSVTTAIPYETLQRCLGERWSRLGRLTAINTAAGSTFDLAFDGVGDDGRVGTGHANFAIEDRGSERRVTASATDPSDLPLATQLLAQGMGGCAGDTARR